MAAGLTPGPGGGTGFPAYPGIAMPGQTYPSQPFAHFATPFALRPLYPRGKYRPFDRMFYAVGLAVLKDHEGFYRTVATPTNEEIDEAAIAYVGGRTYTVSEAEAADLTAAGYEVFYE